MNNPERILATLDGHLTDEVRLILYGRAALTLSFKNSPLEYGATMDVDAILPVAEMPQIETNEDFWGAIEATNRELQEDGLYITHLFADDQVILSTGWLDDLQVIDYPLQHLHLYRPDTHDLILTKMMRVDPQDRSDIEFLLGQSDCDHSILREKISRASIPSIQEIEEAFEKNLNWLESKIKP
jgi:hypothetical protein